MICRIRVSAFGLTVVVLFAGCTNDHEVAATAGQPETPMSVVASSTSVADQWIGRWQGPEGTYLDIGKDGDGFRITISNLDGPRNFQGVARDGGLSFERDGQNELLLHGNGAATGMKWLADKQNCLVVKPGEGFCRE